MHTLSGVLSCASGQKVSKYLFWQQMNANQKPVKTTLKVLCEQRRPPQEHHWNSYWSVLESASMSRLSMRYDISYPVCMLGSCHSNAFRSLMENKR